MKTFHVVVRDIILSTFEVQCESEEEAIDTYIKTLDDGTEKMVGESEIFLDEEDPIADLYEVDQETGERLEVDDDEEESESDRTLN